MKLPSQPIYVETLIRGSIDELWEKTQNPDLHKRWDLRFSDIRYLPRPSEGEPQRFLYATRIGCGMKIEGQGETVGSREESTGERMSALKFWSDDKKSLIKIGSGYWKYAPTADGVRFFTWYDYETRFGVIGQLGDRVLFRPLMSWATAWSFDRLRLWIDSGVDPQNSLKQSLANATARITVAFVWVYHGLVPKLMFHQRDEIVPLINLGFSTGLSFRLMEMAGIAEIVFGCVMLLLWHRKWPMVLTIFAMIGALIGIVATEPQLLFNAFNATTTNIMLISLAIVALIMSDNLPRAAKCLRRMPAKDSP